MGGVAMVENGLMQAVHSSPLLRQRIAVVACVLLLHVLAIWALQSGLLQHVIAVAQEVVLPVSVLPELPAPPKPEVVKAAVPAKPEPSPRKEPPPPVQQVQAPPVVATAPLPMAVADASPAPNAPSGTVTAQPAPAPAPPVPAAAPPALPKVELPSSTADYLRNPKPKYPRLSQSRNEQGTVLLSVLVGADGKVREVTVKSSSGFELLDRTAREAVLAWTFVPGKRNGAPVEMVVDVPIPFRLTD